MIQRNTAFFPTVDRRQAAPPSQRTRAWTRSPLPRVITYSRKNDPSCFARGLFGGPLPPNCHSGGQMYTYMHIFKNALFDCFYNLFLLVSHSHL